MVRWHDINMSTAEEVEAAWKANPLDTQHWCERRREVVNLHTNDPCPDDWDTDDD